MCYFLLNYNSGWREAWVDGVAAEITKRNLKTSAEQCEAVVRIVNSTIIVLTFYLTNIRGQYSCVPHIKEASLFFL
jgi:hypothetical protein